MKKQQKSTMQGFTIIEVVLVLAIAGLIFLMVFVALPGLQRSQRDTQRRNDYAALSTSVTNYMSNHNGKLPKATECGHTSDNSKRFDTDQINSQTTEGENGAKGVDPTGLQYNLSCKDAKDGIAELSKWDPKDSTTDASGEELGPEVVIYTRATCNDSGEVEEAKGSRSFAVYGQLESGTYCNASS